MISGFTIAFTLTNSTEYLHVEMSTNPTDAMRMTNGHGGQMEVSATLAIELAKMILHIAEEK